MFSSLPEITDEAETQQVWNSLGPIDIIKWIDEQKVTIDYFRETRYDNKSKIKACPRRKIFDLRQLLP